MNGDGPRRETTALPARLTWICAALHIPAWALLFLSLVFLVPRFEEVFADFGIALPAITTSAIRASRLLTRFGLVAVPALIGTALALDFLILGRSSSRASAEDSLGWSVVALLIPLGLFGITILAMLIPLASLQSRLAG